MKKITILFSFILLYSCNTASNNKLDYPATEKGTVVDSYFGTEVPDPYRWLEDDNSSKTAEWVETQNGVTFGYLEQIPYRNKIKDRLEEIWNYPKYKSPVKIAGNYYFYKNDGLQNQHVLYTQNEIEAEPEVLIDPNLFSEDGTISMSGTYFSNDGKYLGYSISKGGSDWQEFLIMDLNTRENLNDNLEWIKFSGMYWIGEGFYYNRFPEPLEGEKFSSSNENSKVYYHRLGTPQESDIVIFEDPENPKISNYVGATDDERFVILYRTKGTHGQLVKVMDLNSESPEFVDIINDYDDEHNVVSNIDGKLLMLTTRNAPNKKLVLIDPLQPEDKYWETVIPENKHVLESVSYAGGKLLVNYLQDATSHIYVYNIDGTQEKEIEQPALGTISGFNGRIDDTEVFYSFTSFLYPPTIFRYDLNTGQNIIFRESELDFNPEEYTTKQVFYSSKDDTKIPMFIVHKKDLKIDGNNPTLLYAYGGFNVSKTPYFSVTNVVLLEQGGIYALANLRGGGEYGENWHKAGMLHKKQNVFDDFIAAAEYLIENKYTSSEKLAIRGGSNGGTLIGATINQRPDLAKVAFPAVGVMDMLRYHKFTIGWAWAVEYGSSDEEEHFSNLYSYSPLHNIRDDVPYPATMITTADHDDRVVPAHSFKYAATVQEKYIGDNPILIRIATKAGHGAGKPTSKIIEEYADMWSFMFYNMGIDY